LSERPVHLVDPARTEILLANGPMSVTDLGGMKIVTFTQLSPRVPDVGGLVPTVIDAVVVCRVALSPAILAQMTDLAGRCFAANAPVAGSA
jgi:hypothetical protein